MQFIDKVQLKLKAGNGGNGIVAFKHEKYNPLGGPSGGDGGDGGSIIFVADSNKSTLLDLKYSKTIKAEDGANGKTNSMHGESAEDVIVKVPMGTLIKDLKTNTILADLLENVNVSAMNDYEKVKYVNDFIVQNTVYSSDRQKTHLICHRRKDSLATDPSNT